MKNKSKQEEKKSVAKTGMTLSLGALIATGCMKGKGARIFHIWSGIALVGFSFRHHNLYQPKEKGKKA